ncbi:hypothetical protein Nepgr_020666 [Nepenthes gracilis]|uniref:DUF1677 family protein n=1 Tax=Nepenthes gracilis TaxID=150966 RepID=A0AAD3XWH1_NEPGR|nr:hypothetical protein Nepgr_020666 [Nepenthes gracilis]
MDVELVRCDCCGLNEDCTEEYINGVKARFNGKWLCGLCAEAVRDEISRGKKQPISVEEAVKAHMSFCRKYKSNPAFRVADGMRQMLRRSSGKSLPSQNPTTSSSSSSSKKYSKSTSSSQVGHESSFSVY